MIGKTISHYKILEKLGEGGMGVVYKAEDTKLNRTVALKFISPQSLGTREERKRFVREAQAAAAMDHQNICTVHEIDEVEGQTFIAMTYIEGWSLKKKIESGPLKLEEALDIAIGIAQGLQEAHKRGIVHRDIKSANIMVTKKSEAKIMDFGLAKLVGQTELTKEGVTLGTVAYMSPEQARGEDVDHQTDIWSMGVVLYEMITGRLPFKGDHEQAVIYNIINVQPEPITGLRTGIPLELDRIVSKCLEKKSSDRYQHVDELIVDLRQIQRKLYSASEPAVVTARVFRSRSWVRKPAAWTIMLTIITLIGVVIVFYPQTGVPFSERDWMLITDFENHTGEDVFDDVISEALSIDLQQSQYVNVYSRQRIAEVLKRMGREDMPRIDENVGREIAAREDIKAVLVGSIKRIGEAYILNAQIVNPLTGDAVKTERVEARSSNQVLDAIDDLSKQVRRNLGESLSSIESRDMPLAKVTTNSLDALRFYTLATKHLYKAKWTEAIPLFKKAIEEDSSFAIAYSKLAVMYANVLNVKEALIYSAMAMERRNRVTKRERYYIEAEYYRYRENLKKAIEEYKLLLQLYPDDFNAHNNLAFTYQFTRQYGKALKHSKEAARIAPDSWYPYHNMAGIYAGLGDYEQATAYCLKALSINPEGHWTRVVMSWIFLCQGDSAAAIMELSRLPMGNESWHSIKMLYLALMYRALGKENRALDYLQQGISVDDRAGRDQAQSWKWGETADIYMERGKVDRALNALRKSVEVFRSSYTLMELGIGYAIAGLKKQAEDVLEELQDLVGGRSIHTDLAELERLKGEIAYAKRDFPSAIRYLRTSNFLRDDIETRFSLGRSYLAVKRYDDAIREFKYILDHRFFTFFDGVPNLWPLSQYQLGIAHEEAGEIEIALEYYRRFLAIWESADDERKEKRDVIDRIKLLQANG